ncbi:redoxin domain-containing protein [Sodaliphilus sp.]|uniref:redoxin domain-containing protein n=1 Tax=Sodaliphilus sp. TaxID=2815818 RepID=UPI00388E5AC4
MKRYLYLALIAVAMLCSCTGNQFKVEGKVEGATDSVKLILEESSNGMWIGLDTITVDSDGEFSVSAEAPAYPNIYRLRMGEKAVYFPIDSLDHLTINTKFNAFDTDFTLSGSDHAEQIMKIDKEAQGLSSNASPAQIKAFKDKLAKEIIVDPAGIVAYYVINKNINGRPLFDPLDDSDLRIIGAVANSFNSFRPNDPRTEYLVNVLLAGQQRRRAASAPSDTIQATEAALIDIELNDYTGKNYKLSEVTKQHSVVLLNFTIYDADFSPVYNKLLNDIYTANKSRGLEIYQVSLDPDNVTWHEAARSLPWITVYEPKGEYATCVGAYAVAGVPTTFIIKNGEIVQRVEDGNNLKATVQKYL